jgi:hypothetical protein
LLDTIQHLEACGVDLYLDQQAIDTTTPMGKLVFQLTGAFAEFERTMTMRCTVPVHVWPPTASRRDHFAEKGYVEGSNVAVAQRASIGKSPRLARLACSKAYA